jgi:hypothetical protein
VGYDINISICDTTLYKAHTEEQLELDEEESFKSSVFSLRRVG